MKGKLSTAAVGIGIGIALCNPVAGAIVAGVGVAGAMSKVANLAPPPGYSHKPLKPIQAFLATVGFLSMLGILASIGTLVCDDICGMTPSSRLLDIGLFFGVMLICIIGSCRIPDYTDEEAQEVWRKRDQKEWRAIWDNKYKFYLRNEYNVPEGEKYRKMAAEHFKGSHLGRMHQKPQKPAQTALATAQTTPHRTYKALPEPNFFWVSEDNGQSWFMVEQPVNTTGRV